ncbi:DUF11 domain-containing protein [Psychrobacter sp. I-STPA10]|uniref:DUF11 domain-containing protein n=1 Tax=Psychrobacter sp. I-STPA10 TaxID=2585769 RepID=UPI001E4ABFC5|nr:DUF11 domain-containing protein [Psychrobacter sp. I-STPA10]
MYDLAGIRLPIVTQKKYIHTTIIIATGTLISTGAMAAGTTAARAPMCPTGYVAADFSPSDYEQLSSAGPGGTINVKGINDAIADLGLQLKINMTTNGAQPHYIRSYTSNGQTGFTIVQNLGNNNASNTVNFDFNKPVNKLSFTLSDIDYRSTSWRDKITVIGKNGNTPVPLQFSNSGNSMATNNATGTVESDGPGNGGIECINPSNPSNFSGVNDDFTPKCATTVTFDSPITKFTLDYRNTVLLGVLSQDIELQFNKFCVEEKKLEIEKDDGIVEVSKDSITDYVIKVKNQSNGDITGAILSDPFVSGLIKQSNIQCDSSITNNACITAPTITQLENGFPLPTLSQGQTYAITVPTKITANYGSEITNTATVDYNSKTISDTDTNTVKSPFVQPSNPTTTTGSCPANHQMYYIGENAPSGSISMALSWIDGALNKTFEFTGSNGNKVKMTLAFPLLIDKYERTNIVPFYQQGGDETTRNALTIEHTSVGKVTNHELQAIINKPVSQLGFTIQDLDSTGYGNGGHTPPPQYIEQVDVSESQGKLTHNPSYHTINAAQDIVTAKPLLNCDIEGQNTGCPISATWGYKPTNTPFSLKHNNTEEDRGKISHVIGYSDFYFCLAPPKIIINKVLNGNRIATEQFNIKITDNNTFSKGFTTEGTDNSIAPGKNTSGILELKPNTTYTITESIVKGGNDTDYNTTYQCSNLAKDSSAQIPQNGTGKSFSISQLSYGDEIACTITNTPKVKKTYTFSGIVFNDNGGIEVDATAYNKSQAQELKRNSEYFNGIYNDSSEKGIFATGLTAKLTNCQGQDIPNQTLNFVENGTDKGKYTISVPAAQVETHSQVCIKQIEPQSWQDSTYGANVFPVDTTKNEIEVAIVSGQYNYPNNNFGEVRQNNSALVLIKRQHFHNCSAKNLTAVPVNDSADPKDAFSQNPIVGKDNIGANQCIAYRIEARNRANVGLQSISITDSLPKKGENDSSGTLVLTTPAPTSDSGITFASNSVTDNHNGNIITNSFDLPLSTKEKSIFFNTKFQVGQ